MRNTWFSCPFVEWRSFKPQQAALMSLLHHVRGPSPNVPKLFIRQGARPVSTKSRNTLLRTTGVPMTLGLLSYESPL